ncbi:MAG: DUF5131 family protein [Chroococcales cyanobacterium]
MFARCGDGPQPSLFLQLKSKRRSRSSAIASPTPDLNSGYSSMKNTGIEWTDSTINPFFYRLPNGHKAFVCRKVSAACANCYAETMEQRFKTHKGGGLPYNDRNVYEVNWEKDFSLIQKATGKVFISSMTDVMGDWLPLDWKVELLRECANNPHATFQILTKWPHEMVKAVEAFGGPLPPHIWLGVTAEKTQQQWRIDELKKIPATVRFVSCEPILEQCEFNLDGIHWLIVGGESGSKHRPPQLRWVASLRDQCLSSEIAFFFKQWGGATPKKNGRTLEGFEWSQFPDVK